jgi:hypothetical protein
MWRGVSTREAMGESAEKETQKRVSFFDRMSRREKGKTHAGEVDVETPVLPLVEGHEPVEHVLLRRFEVPRRTLVVGEEIADGRTSSEDLVCSMGTGE